jgi:predicted transcriptional regulator
LRADDGHAGDRLTRNTKPGASIVPKKPPEPQPLRTTLDTLSKIFVDEITAKFIAEELEPCEREDDSDKIRALMEEKDYDVYGIITDGAIYGYVERDELKGGPCKQYEKIFHPAELVSDSTPLVDVFIVLREEPRVFVLYSNHVEGIVTRADLQKGPVRLMLYALTALLEVHLQRLIYMLHGDGTWDKLLKPVRLSKARDFHKKLADRNESIDLISCLQFIDKANMLMKSSRSAKVLKHLKLDKREAAEIFFDEARQLRDNLAHSHDLTTKLSWPRVIDLAVRMIQVLRGCEDIGANPGKYRQTRF